MALTCQLDPEESAEPRKRCSCKIHHPRNSQLWVIDSYCWGRGSRLAERDRLPSLIIRLIIWQRDPLWNANSALINVSQETKQRRADDISIWYIFLVSGCAFLSLVRAFLNHSSRFYVFIFHFLSLFFLFLPASKETSCSLCKSQQHIKGSCWRWTTEKCAFYFTFVKFKCTIFTLQVILKV